MRPALLLISLALVSCVKQPRPFRPRAAAAPSPAAPPPRAPALGAGAAPAAPAAAAPTPWAARPFTPGGAYTGPFTLLSADVLSGVPDAGNGFGPEDKLVPCNGKLVFVDLDDAAPSSRVFSYDTGTGAWRSDVITANACPDPSQGGLLPRSAGYTVGSAAGPSGDRLLVLGGSESGENNVYFSDTCGLTWDCYDGPQVWLNRKFAPVVHTPGVFAGDPIVLAGGLSSADGGQSYAFSIGLFLSYDFGIHWFRPECPSAQVCSFQLEAPDASGQCSAVDGNPTYYQHCFTLPYVEGATTPWLPGSLAADWDTLWGFVEGADVGGGGRVFALNRDLLQYGWSEVAGAADGGYGRKVFIRGAVAGSGCWFSTDFLAEDLWVYLNPTLQSTNGFSTAPAATGPWTNWTGVATPPWRPRASAAVATSYRGTVAYFASGMEFVDGEEQPYGCGPGPGSSCGDVWQIDVGVCLLAPSSGAVCNGHGAPDLDAVACACDAGYSGAFCEGGGGGGAAAAAAGRLSPGAALGVSLLVVAGAAAAAALLAPKWGFSVAGVRVAPGEVVRKGAAGAWAAGEWALLRLRAAATRGGGGGGGAAMGAPAAAEERVGLGGGKSYGAI